MDYKVNDIKQQDPLISLEQLIDKAVSLGVLGELDGYKAHRMMKEDRYIAFTHELLMGAFDEVARMQEQIKQSYKLMRKEEV